jgi:tetratricopeptide (TPR) repeat protein
MGSRIVPRAALLALAAVLCLSSVASAFGTSPKKKKTESKATAGDSAAVAARAQAEALYKEGWELSEQAKKDEKHGQGDMAMKKFCKARKKYEVAVSVDSTYYEAWNMVGFCARHCGDLSASMNAYMKCLAIAPDYEEMHEYLGELYIQLGDMDKARAELAWLEERKSKEAKELAEYIEKAQKAPVAPAAATQKTVCDPDSAPAGKAP